MAAHTAINCLALLAALAGACGGSGDAPSDGKGGGSGGGAPEPSGAAAGQASGATESGDAGSEPSAGGTAGSHDGAVPVVPDAPADCPIIADGTITVLEREVRIWTGPAATPGPLVFYWHGTGSVAGEAQVLLGDALAEIQASGGVLASFTTTTAQGVTTGNRVWYTGDFAMADIILACALQQGLVDARQVYAAGCSAGGLQAGAMAYGRSSYVAAVAPNSGGIIGKPALQDAAHAPAVITSHGGPDDFVIISFAESSAQLDQDIRDQGGFVVDCDHGGGHCQSPPEVLAAQWQFLKAHPFGVEPEPYAAALPATFPAACQIVK
jgi:poly(3-hydroxybutyrate) depolymerase